MSRAVRVRERSYIDQYGHDLDSGKHPASLFKVEAHSSCVSSEFFEYILGYQRIGTGQVAQSTDAYIDKKWIKRIKLTPYPRYHLIISRVYVAFGRIYVEGSLHIDEEEHSCGMSRRARKQIKMEIHRIRNVFASWKSPER